MPTQLFFSNAIDALTDVLARDISGHRDLFNPISIIVPNPYTQKWIQLKIAERLGISMNTRFLLFNDGIKRMMDSCNPDEKKPSILSQTDIQLLIYHALTIINPHESPAPLITEYLHGKGAARKDDYDHKIWQLASRLSRYFMEYEVYRQDMIRSWMMGKPLMDNAMELSQQYLYHALFKEGGYRDSIDANWLTLPQYFSKASFQAPTGHVSSYIIFGESHLSPFHANLIFELGKHLDIAIYQLNPCSEFWEDVTTPREDRWQKIRSINIKKEQGGEELPYEENENQLLKLWGKTGRETIKLLSQIEEAGSREQRCTSEWIEPAHTITGTTMLGIVQDQILRRTTMHDPSEKISQDSSIHVASCPDLFREAEAVYNSILLNLEHDRTLKMTDIAIMVPDMELYAPVIHSIFTREPRRLAYCMIDSTAAADSLFAKAIHSLFEIATGSFTRKEISNLVRNACFYEAHSMTLSDVMVWLTWADDLNIFREFNKTDSLDPEANQYTWQQGLLRIRFGRIMNTRLTSIQQGKFLSFKNIIPYSDINTGDRNLVDRMSSLIELLHARTAQLHSLETSVAEWIQIISCLVRELLVVPVHKPEEQKVYENLMDGLAEISILDRFSETKEPPLLSITAIREIITDILTAMPSARGNYLTSGINVSAMVPKRQIPFRIIYLMGMHEGAFPGATDSSTLNLMMIKRRIGDVTRPDINRYHFLETLLMAREKLYITYISKDLQKDQDIHPNSVTGQLMTYLNNYVINNTFLISRVPASASSFDYLRDTTAHCSPSEFLHTTLDGAFQPTLFKETDRLLLFQKYSRITPLPDTSAKILSEKLKTRIPDFSLSPTAGRKVSETESVSLHDLRNFLINPVESTLRWHLSLYDNETEETSEKENEPFFSVFPYNYSFIINALNFSLQSDSVRDIDIFIQNYYKHARLMGDTPPGAYAEIDYEQLRTNILERFQSTSGLFEFLQSRKRYMVHHIVAFGAIPSAARPDMSFPPACCPVSHRGTNCIVELKGSLPVLWINPDTGDCETLVITNSIAPSLTHLIPPFLFFAVSAANYNPPLHDCTGSGPFTIHVSHKEGISSYTYHLSESESRGFLHGILNDFLDDEQFDHLPLPIISEKKMLSPADMKDDPSPAEQAEYRQSLINLIDDDADKMNPLYRPIDLVQLINPEVPADAYIKVRDRLRMLFKQFTDGDQKQ